MSVIIAHLWIRIQYFKVPLCVRIRQWVAHHSSQFSLFASIIFSASRKQVRSYLNLSWSICDADIFLLLLKKFSRHFSILHFNQIWPINILKRKTLQTLWWLFLEVMSYKYLDYVIKSLCFFLHMPHLTHNLLIFLDREVLKF